MLAIGLQELGKVDLYSEMGRQSEVYIYIYIRNLPRGTHGCKLASLAHCEGKCRNGVCWGNLFNLFAQPSWRMEV